MKTSSSLTVEITVLSAENLRIDRKLVKKNAFVIVQPDGFDSQTTRTDALGGAYPSWNEKLLVNLPTNARFIYLDVQCNTSSGNRRIGIARVPVSDFVGGYVPENHLQFLSYRLRDSKEQKNGIINICVRVKTPEYATCSSKSSGLMLTGYAACSSQATGLNIQGYGMNSSSQPRLGVPVGGVVTGVPVWCANHA